jgi:hypothetical protein
MRERPSVKKLLAYEHPAASRSFISTLPELRKREVPLECNYRPSFYRQAKTAPRTRISFVAAATPPISSSTLELVADRLITFPENVGRENITPGPTAAWAAASIRKSPGLSCAPCATVRRARARSCGVDSKPPVRMSETNQESLEVNLYP